MWASSSSRALDAAVALQLQLNVHTGCLGQQQVLDAWRDAACNLIPAMYHS